ncbi:hypothetical protein GCM10027612_20810 [Microbispora bryophytorum subsp. camponoti]
MAASSRAGGASLTTMPGAAPAPEGSVSGRGLQQQLGDGGRFQEETEAQCRPLGVRLGELPGDRQVDRGDQILPGAVLEDPVTEREPFGALGDDRQHGAGHRGRRRIRPVDLRDEEAVDGGGPVGPGMPGQQSAELVEAHAAIAA